MSPFFLSWEFETSKGFWVFILIYFILFCFVLFCFAFTEQAVLSRDVSAGHRCLQVQRHRQRCQCQCPVTNAQRPPLRISCPSSSTWLQLSLIHDHAEGHVFSRPSGHTLFSLLSTLPHPLHIAHSDTSQLSGWSVTFREITGTCSISPKSDGLSCQLLHCDYI